MSILYAIILGIIQGITEFLPVSSSGHLAIAQTLLGMEEADLLFDIILHIGTLIAIFLVYYKDIIRLVVEGFKILGCWFYNGYTFFANLFRKEKAAYKTVVTNGYRKFALLVIVSSIPTAIIGVLDKDLVKQASTILLVPGICLLITGAVLVVAQFAKGGEKLPKEATYPDALVIGTAQGIATMPGISRSGMTLAAALLCGFDRKFAVKYSFIMSIPAILGSLLFELADADISAIDGNYVLCALVGLLVSAAVGYICIKLMLFIVREKNLIWFSVYCWVVGIIAIAGYFYLN